MDTTAIIMSFINSRQFAISPARLFFLLQAITILNSGARAQKNTENKCPLNDIQKDDKYSTY
jgi:hypothetical protein